MKSLYFMIPTLLVIFFSYFIVTAASVILRITGLDTKKAKFQALSAFTGTGFTTKESELITNHPVRRRVIFWLMISGNAGIVTAVVTTTSSLVSSKGAQSWMNVLLLIGGIYAFYKVVTKTRLVKKWEELVRSKFIKSSLFEEKITEDLLHFSEGYAVIDYSVKKESKLVDTHIRDLKLNAKGILILGIERNEKWIPIPTSDEKIQIGDKIVLYGKRSLMQETLQTP